MTADARLLESSSIAEFVFGCARDGLLAGAVLDYGSGAQPYRDIVERWGGAYEPFDRAAHPANVGGRDDGPSEPLEATWDAILCTQVVQYVPDVQGLLGRFRGALRPAGRLVLTYPTCWPEVEPQDLHRFTRAGMERMLERAGLRAVRHQRRAAVRVAGVELALGYGAVAVPA